MAGIRQRRSSSGRKLRFSSIDSLRALMISLLSYAAFRPQRRMAAPLGVALQELPGGQQRVLEIGAYALSGAGGDDDVAFEKRTQLLQHHIVDIAFDQLVFQRLQAFFDQRWRAVGVKQGV